MEDPILSVTLGPALALLLVLLVALLAYGARLTFRGPFEDPEMTARGSTPLLPMGARQFFAWVSRPFVRVLVRTGISADAITLFSIALAAGAGLAVAWDRFAVAGWLYLATGLCDFFDGRVARAYRTAGPRGAVLDSVVDRYAEGLLLTGLAWSYRAEPTLLVVLLALTGSFLVPYVRARAEAAAAATSNVGLMQRPERVVLLGTTLVLSPAAQVLVAPGADLPHHALAAVGVAVLGLLSHATAIHRLVHVMRALSAAPPVEEPEEDAIGPAVVVEEPDRGRAA